jgi:two-component system NtrC family sensor kinase
MVFFRSLTFRVLIGSFVLLLALFALYSAFAIRLHTDHMMAQVVDSATRVSDIIKKSTRYHMLLNRREDVFEIIRTIGEEPGVEGIRIYNKLGQVMFSTDSSETGKVVDMQAEACYACHDRADPLQSLPPGNRSRIYRSPQGARLVGLINPIRNEPSCSTASCHAHPADRTVLGVLDVRMSLAQVDAGIAAARRNLIITASLMTALVACGSGMFLFLTLHRPVRKLIEGTREISSGNLGHRITEISQSDIGALANSFNEMSRSLQQAEVQNRVWSETLEKRVAEKTSELRQIHQQILQIEKMASLGKLSATVAHELNNPLEGILTYAKLITKRMRRIENPSDSVRQTVEDMELIIREVQRCGNIVKNMLLFSKKQVADLSLVPLGPIVDRAVQLVQHHFKISNVEFEMHIDDRDASLVCDGNQIQQALVALFVNGVEAMPGGGTLILRINRLETGELTLQISDSGSGIRQEDLTHVFEPFFTTKKEGNGVGLGLSVVYGIVERHGGTIQVQSEVGKGTTFTLLFPPASGHHPGAQKETGTVASEQRY